MHFFLSQLMKYMESLPPAVKPKVGSDGAKYRRKQMMYQLPIHDHDENYCDNLTEPERASMRQFCDDRNQYALGVGDVREKTNPVSKWVRIYTVALIIKETTLDSRVQWYLIHIRLLLPVALRYRYPAAPEFYFRRK